MTTYTIHFQPGIAWHFPFARAMASGLDRLGIPFALTTEQSRVSDDCAILLGTSCFRAVEATGEYLLVDRCSFGDTNKYVSLVFNGHGRRGDHKIPFYHDASRWALHGVELAPWVKNAGTHIESYREGRSRLVCAGQMEAYAPKLSPAIDALDFWYDSMNRMCTHFRPHPAADAETIARGPSLDIWRSWDGVRGLMTFNSSVAIEALIHGIPADVDDEGGMAYGWRAKCRYIDNARLELMQRLAWTQWHHDEISLGEPIRHLFA